MSTTRQKVIVMHFTRFLIFTLGSLAILLDRPIGDFLGVLSLGLWLWLPVFVSLELKLVERWIK
jgi:hypothetical protein